METLEERVLEDIVRRIKINSKITSAADWQIYQLKNHGAQQEFIRKTIQESLKLSNDEIEDIYQKATETSYVRDKKLYEASAKPYIPLKDNAELKQTLASVIEQTKDDLANITQSMGFSLDYGNKKVFAPLATYYQTNLDNAMMQIITGEFSYDTVLARTVKEMAKSGIRTVDYASGITTNIVTASRRAIVTGIAQITGKINEYNARQLDTDLFEVSWHATARPSHQVWQGKVWTKEQLSSVCGLGTVQGLCGANCRHSYSPFIEGVSERTYTDAELESMNAKENIERKFGNKTYTSYEATQRMRNMEYLMRSQRQEIRLLKKGEADEETISKVMASYKVTSEQYSMFAKKMKLPEERQRVYIDGLGRV